MMLSNGQKLAGSLRVACKSCAPSVINGFPCHEAGCPGFFEFTDANGLKYNKFDIWSLDVWGNQREGFEVNDRHLIGICTLRDDALAREVCLELKALGVLAKNAQFRSFEIEWHDERSATISHRRTGEPCFELEAL
jgi:hypothetical protein